MLFKSGINRRTLSADDLISRDIILAGWTKKQWVTNVSREGFQIIIQFNRTLFMKMLFRPLGPGKGHEGVDTMRAVTFTQNTWSRHLAWIEWQQVPVTSPHFSFRLKWTRSTPRRAGSLTGGPSNVKGFGGGWCGTNEGLLESAKQFREPRGWKSAS